MLMLAACGGDIASQESVDPPATAPEITASTTINSTTTTSRPTTSSPTIVETTAAEESTSTSAPLGDDAPEWLRLLMSGIVVGDGLQESERRCVDDAFIEDFELEARNTDFGSMGTADHARALENLLDCTGILIQPGLSKSLQESAFGSDALLTSGANECITEGLLQDDEDQLTRISTLVYFGTGEPLGDAESEVGAAFLTRCLRLEDVFAPNGVAQLFDRECLSAAGNDDADLLYWFHFLRSGLEGAPLETVNHVLDCTLFGEIVGAELRELVQLSIEEMSCIDAAHSQLRWDRNLWVSPVTREELLQLLMSCASDETIAALES